MQPSIRDTLDDLVSLIGQKAEELREELKRQPAADGGTVREGD